MKSISTTALLCLLTLCAHASSQKEKNKDDYSDFLLEAHKEKSGTMWHKEKTYLYSEFNVTISNTEKKAKTFPSGTCIILFDENSEKKALANGINLKLLGSYQPYESKTGSVIFRSADPEVQSLRFIKLSNNECLNPEGNFIIKP